MDSSAPMGKLSELHVVHHGCWASGLSLYLNSERPDLELVVYARSVINDPSSYRAAAIIKSKEKKEISLELHTAITQYLLSHTIIRSVKPRLVLPSDYTCIFLIRAFDDKTPASIRGVLDHGGIIHPRIGMPVIKGVEKIRFLSENPAFILGQIQTAYSQYPHIYDVREVEIGHRIFEGEEELFEDPYYLPTYIICTEENRKGFIDAVKDGIESLVEWIEENATWLIPLFTEVLKWYSSETAYPQPYVF